jgi:predicted DNA-binding protein with PD1-like motif
VSEDTRVIEQISLDAPLLIRLVPGDSFFEATNRILAEHGIERGVFLSAIGSLADVSFRNLKAGIGLPVSEDKTVPVEEAGPFELLSFEGTFVPMDGEPRYNVHVLLGREDGSVIGGHLFAARVFTTLEIVLVRLGGSTVVKASSDVTGLTEYQTSPRSP